MQGEERARRYTYMHTYIYISPTISTHIDNKLSESDRRSLFATTPKFGPNWKLLDFRSHGPLEENIDSLQSFLCIANKKCTFKNSYDSLHSIYSDYFSISHTKQHVRTTLNVQFFLVSCRSG